MAPQGRDDLARWKSAADKIVGQQCGKFPWLRQEADAVSNYAVTQLLTAMKRQALLNSEAYLNRVVINRMNDLGRQHKVDQARLQFFDDERPSKSGEPGGFYFGGLSNEFIRKEDQRMAALKAAAVVAIMPKEYDQLLLAERFYDDEVSMAEIARRRRKAPNAMGNYLQRILGGNGNVGAVEPVFQMIGRLDLATAAAFVKILQEYNTRDTLTDPIAGAVSQLEFNARYSDEHRKLAAMGVSRLRWLKLNKVDSRGLTNQLLNRLVKAACFYVHEVNDAKHDRNDSRGLQDDVKVLKVVSEVLREFRTK